MDNFIIDNRSINVPVGIQDIAISGDTNSRTLEFTIERFFDGVDLTTKKVQVNYTNAEKLTGSTQCVIGTVDTEYFTFKWTIGSATLYSAGKVYFAVEFYEEDEPTQRKYVWQTKPQTFIVERSIIVKNDAISHNYLQEIIFYNNHDNFGLSDLVDDDTPITITNRTIEAGIMQDIAVSLDTMSQIITFRMPRFFDGIDRASKLITIKFLNAAGQGDHSSAVNKKVMETTIEFGWILNGKVTIKDGNVLFAIEILGYTDDTFTDFYVWQTKPAGFKIEKGIFVDGNIESPDPSWIQSLYFEIAKRANSLKYENSQLSLLADGLILSTVAIGGSSQFVEAEDENSAIQNSQNNPGVLYYWAEN